VIYLPLDAPHRDRMCTNKHVYLTRSEAVRAAKRIRKRDGESGRTVRQYRCKYCNLWHVGHNKTLMVAGREQVSR
jgi:hypothetical protein